MNCGRRKYFGARQLSDRALWFFFSPGWGLRGTTFLTLLALPFSTVVGARVYYINQPENGFGEIHAMNPDGSGQTTILTTSSVSDLRGIAVDPITSRLFYAHADSDPSTSARTNVSLRSIPSVGGTPTVLTNFPDGTFIADVEWDGGNGWVYFAETGNQQLRRLRPDGSGLTTVINAPPGQAPYFFGLDLVAGNAYWGVGTQPGDTDTAYSRGSLSTGLIDSTFTLITPSRTRDIAIDRSVPGGILYWCDRQNGAVYKRPIEGETFSAARFDLNAPHGLVLDVAAGKAYVADTGKRGSGSQPSAHRVVRFDLDGSGEAELLSPEDLTAEPWDLAIDLTTTNYADWKMRFFRADASNVAPADDPDKDGRSNLGEYAFFTHPEKVDALPQALTAAGRGVQFARRLATDLAYRVEVSRDLQTWHWNNDAAGTVWTTDEGTAPRDSESEWVNVRLTSVWANEETVFFRVRAVQTAFSPARLQKKLRRR